MWHGFDGSQFGIGLQSKAPDRAVPRVSAHDRLWQQQANKATIAQVSIHRYCEHKSRNIGAREVPLLASALLARNSPQSVTLPAKRRSLPPLVRKTSPANPWRVSNDDVKGS